MGTDPGWERASFKFHKQNHFLNLAQDKARQMSTLTITNKVIQRQKKGGRSSPGTCHIGAAIKKVCRSVPAARSVKIWHLEKTCTENVRSSDFCGDWRENTVGQKYLGTGRGEGTEKIIPSTRGRKT